MSTKRFAVVIAERDEPDLPNTIESIRATAPDAQPVVMHDSKGLGPMRARHLGIVAAESADVIIVVDGHMRFAAGTLQGLADYVRKHPKHIATARCHHNNRIEFNGTPYAGARIEWIDGGKDGERHFNAFPAKWRQSQEAGKIGCVMGACYAFSREWYLEGLGSPWQFGTGWGCDEELLSIANWLHGGENVLLDLAVAHQERDKSGQPFSYTAEQYAGLWANRLRMLTLLPLSDAERDELSAHMGRNRFNAHSKDMIDDALFRFGRPEAYRERLRRQKRTFAEWRLTWEGRDEENPVTVKSLRADLAKLDISAGKKATRGELARLLVDAQPPTRTTTPPPAPKPQAPAQVIVRPPEICRMCGTHNSFRASTGPRVVGSIPVSYGKCSRCGHKMQVRYS